MYLWPAGWAAQGLGVMPFTLLHGVVAAAYCAALGWAAATMASRLLRLPARVERRRALLLIAIVWLPIVAFAGYQVLGYAGVTSNETQCPGHLYALQQYCHDISNFKEHELAGFIDRTFVATLRVRPGVLPDIVAANAMKEISPADVPSSFWSQPPFWWTIRRKAAA